MGDESPGGGRGKSPARMRSASPTPSPMEGPSASAAGPSTTPAPGAPSTPAAGGAAAAGGAPPLPAQNGEAQTLPNPTQLPPPSQEQPPPKPKQLKFKQPPQKSYLPTYQAPEAYGKKKAIVPVDELVRQQLAAAEEKKQREERAKERRRRAAKAAAEAKPEEEEDDGESAGAMFVKVAIGIVIALIEAVDIEVLLGILFYPFIKVMKSAADYFDNIELDPSVWMRRLADSYNALCKNYPAGFVLADFGAFAFFVCLILFWADLARWWRARKVRSQGYESMEDEEAAEPIEEEVFDPDKIRMEIKGTREHLEAVVLQLRLKGAEHHGANTPGEKMMAELHATRASLEGRISALNEKLANEGFSATSGDGNLDLEAAAKAAARAELEKKKQGGCGELAKTAVTVLKNAIAGFITIYLYFMDLISDIQVTMLLWGAGAFSLALASASLLMGQFLVVWIRVLPYLLNTYGADSTFYRLFLYVGMPFGCFFLDFLMFLEPFGLLPITPMPETLRQFIPAYKATRIIAEVVIEALPQCMMQAIIFILVSSHVRDGTAAEGSVYMKLYTANNGSFVSLMPKSILISSLTMLKTWLELVQDAREAGISVAKKGLQLWNVGAGLPLDAIKKGSISKWKCQYEISDAEVVSLVDALGKNKSLKELDLSLAGLEWMPPIKREARSALSSLLTTMHKNPKALEALETLHITQDRGDMQDNFWSGLFPGGNGKGKSDDDLRKIFDEIDEDGSGTLEVEEIQNAFQTRLDIHKSDAEILELFKEIKSPNATDWESVDRAEFKRLVDFIQSGGASAIGGAGGVYPPWPIPVGALRSGPEKALKALNEVPFLSKGGPSREELHAMFELLCKNRSVEPNDSELEVSMNAATKVFTAAQKDGGGSTKKAKRLQWQKGVAQLLAKGMTRRSHFAFVVGAEVLRNVGLDASELLGLQFKPAELKAGGFEAIELKEAGFGASALKGLGYTPRELLKAEIAAVEMQALGYTARQLREGGYTAKQLKDSRAYSLSELKEGGYKAEELSLVGYQVPELRQANFTALELRKAPGGVFKVGMMRAAGYSAPEMKSAGYDAKRILEAGYSAKEAAEAGYTPVQMYTAGFQALGLRNAGFTAETLREAGYDLNALQGAFYTGEELQRAGYTAQQLKEAGTSLSQLKAAGTPMAKLKESGYTALRLKQQGYTAAELSFGARGRLIDPLTKEVASAIAAPATPQPPRRAATTAIGSSASASSSSASPLRISAIDSAIDTMVQMSHRLYGGAPGTASGSPSKKVAPGGGGAPVGAPASAASAAVGGVTLEDGMMVTRDEGGYTAKEQRAGTITASELKRGKVFFHVSEWKDGLWTTKELKEGGYTAQELLGVGYEAAELYKVGYSVADLVKCGVSISTLHSLGATLVALRDAGASLSTLRECGFTAMELLAIGFNAEELFACGFGVSELREAGFSAVELRQLGFTAKQLKDYGFSALALKESGSVLKELKQLGYPDDELEAAGYSKRAVAAWDGRPMRELKDEGNYSVAELKSYGFVAADLRGVYPVRDLHNYGDEANYSLEELKAAGIPEHAVDAVDGRSTDMLREAGYKPHVLRRVGFELYELVEGGYTAAELTIAHYGIEDLKEAGFSASDLREAGFTSRQLHAARYKLKEMREGGYLWQDLVIHLRATHAELTRAGFADLNPKHELFLLYREKDDGGISDLSAISPRRQFSPRMGATLNSRGALMSPSRGRPMVDGEIPPDQPLEFPPNKVYELNEPLKVRSGVALTSKRNGTLKKGTKLKVLDSRTWFRDGTQRVCVAPVDLDEESGTAPQMLPLGWVTAKPPPSAVPPSRPSSSVYFSPLDC